MSIDDTSVEVQEAENNTNLDDFEKEFFQIETPEKVEEDAPEDDAPKPVEEETPDEADEDDTPAEDDAEEDEQEEAVAEPAPKPKKNRFQERIDEVVGKQRETERQLQAALDELSNLKKTPEQKQDVAPVTAPDEPDFNAKNDDGTDKYPLGEYDPNYVKDLARFTFQQERANFEAETKKAQAEQEETRQRAALQEDWQSKLGPAQERYPDFQTKVDELGEVFVGIDQNYGEYLAATLMSLEYGPDVLYYLANNPDEARKIVQSGVAKAPIALGRLEAKFAVAAEEKQQARPKVSTAPPPPEHLNKGSSAAKVEVDDDTDDLDAFETKFFKKKR